MRTAFASLFRLNLALLLASLALTACGDDDDDADTAADTGAPADDDDDDSATFDPGKLPATGVTCDASKNLCTLNGAITENFTIKKGIDYLLAGQVQVGDGAGKNATLTIEPGAVIFGTTTDKSFLLIHRGSTILAEGTRDEPIIFTSAKPDGTRAPGDWGGIIVNGYAPLNRCGTALPCEAQGEGGTGVFGGDDPTDSSGVIRYVRIEFAGRLVDVDDELNGLALQGVGSGTTLEYIHIHRSKDDGIEFFGGSANVRYLLITGIQDDSLDWTDGWNGKAQFVVAQQYADAANNGIEADNNNQDNNAQPRSKPTLSNITLIGSPDSEFSQFGILLREGTAGEIANSIVTGFGEACLDLEHGATFETAFDNSGALTGELTLHHSILSCKSNFTEQGRNEPHSGEDFFSLNESNRTVDPQLAAPYNTEAPGFAPKAGSPALTGAKKLSDPFFVETSFIGAVDPSNDWTTGWTTFPAN